VVCIGGGYVAAYLVKALRRAVRRGEVDLTVVSRNNFHTFHGFVPEMLGNRIQPGQIISPARRLFAPARFHNAHVEGIDVQRRVVTTSRRLDGRQFELPYDHLVVGLGARDDLERYPGLAEHALTLADYSGALKARNHLLAAMEMAAIETDPQERARLLTFVVVGGGYGGVEVATELDDYLRGLTRRVFPTVAAAEIRVVLVYAGERLLGELEARQPKLQRWAERFIRERTGIELRPGRRVTAATPTEAVLDDGERLPTRTLISCTGTAQSPLLDTLPYERDARGRLVTDGFVRVVGERDVWAGGDCAAVPHPRGGTNPPLAIFAMATGWRIGRNILRTIRGKPPRPYRFTELGDACALGRRRAVAHVRGVRVTGFPAWLMWRAFLLAFLPSPDRRLRTVLDWIVTPIVGRDVAQLQLDEPMGMRREIYEPGQDIVIEGDLGQRLYVIQSGQADVLQGLGPEPPVRLATLGPGDHFGEVSVFEGTRRSATVRATTRVEVLSLGREFARSLSDVSAPIGQHLRHRPVRTEDPASVEVDAS
jgi:NADH:ubiquinone reductase (H+-translocating)